MSLIGNVIATLCVGSAVFLALQWRPNPNDDWTAMAAVTLAYMGGLFTALSSVSKIVFSEEPDEKEMVDNENRINSDSHKD